MLPWRRSQRDRPSQGESELSPLDRIRQAEAEATRRVAAAREASERRVAAVRSQAQYLKEQAHKSGKQEGQAKYAEIINEADVEAQALIAQAQNRVEQMLAGSQQQIDVAAQLVLELILMDKGTEAVTP